MSGFLKKGEFKRGERKSNIKYQKPKIETEKSETSLVFVLWSLVFLTGEDRVRVDSNKKLNVKR